MAKSQHELVLTNITFELLYKESSDSWMPVNDTLDKVDLVNGKYNKYHVKLGALTNAQIAELCAFCGLAGIYVTNVTNYGDSYKTAVTEIAINSIGMDEMFVIPDRTQNPYVTIKLWHVPSPVSTDKISVRLASIKPYTTGEDEKDEMQRIIGELKEFADETGTPVVTAEQPKISNRITLHGVIVRNITEPDQNVVDITFDNVSDEDLEALVKLYKEHPLDHRASERHQLISRPSGEKYSVTIGIYVLGINYKSYILRDTPIDFTIELHMGHINPIIYDVTLAEDKQLSDSKMNSNIKKEENKMTEVTLKSVWVRKLDVLISGSSVSTELARYAFCPVTEREFREITELYNAHPIVTQSDRSDRRVRPHFIKYQGCDAGILIIGIFGGLGKDIETSQNCFDITIELRDYKINPVLIDSKDGMIQVGSNKVYQDMLRYVETQIVPNTRIESARKHQNDADEMEENIMRTPIKNVFFNGHATIIMWTDGTKTVVKPITDDKFDPEMGIAMALARKFFKSRHQFEKFTASAFRESYARDAKSLTEKELSSLLQDNENIIASAKAKHHAAHQAYEKAVQEGSKKLPKLYGLKSDPDYRYASIRVSVIKAELESRKAKKAAVKATASKKTKKK